MPTLATRCRSRARLLRWALVALTLEALSGCAYHVGAGLTAGAFDELQGEGRSGGIGQTAEVLLEQQVLAELGHQLGQGLADGATELDPEQVARLQRSVDGLITAAARRAGKGLRDEVSPELREMVQKDIVRALAEGIRGEVGDSLEETVDRVVSRAITSLRESVEDEQMRIALAALLRDSVFFAMQEDGVTPGVGRTLEETLTTNMLSPIEASIDRIDEQVASRVGASAQRTEQMLRLVTGALIVIAGVFGILYLLRNRQVQRLVQQNDLATRDLRNLDAALGILDPSTRNVVLAKLEEYEALGVDPKASRGARPAPTIDRGDDYQRRH